MNTETNVTDIKDYRDDMTLDEMAINDDAMIEAMLKKCKRSVFKGVNPREYQARCEKYIGLCVDTALKKCGVTITRGMHPTMAKVQLRRNNVSIESRKKGLDGNDEKKRGIYIYKDGVLAYFIGFPGLEKESPLSIDPVPVLVVRTNVEVTV